MDDIPLKSKLQSIEDAIIGHHHERLLYLLSIFDVNRNEKKLCMYAVRENNWIAMMMLISEGYITSRSCFEVCNNRATYDLLNRHDNLPPHTSHTLWR